MYYRRATAFGATWFFTINLANRRESLLVDHIDALRDSLRIVKQNHPFEIVAAVILPEHLHLLIELPPNDNHYPMRIALLKSGFSRRLPKTETIRASRLKKRERGIWQRRYWEHQIRDARDLEIHADYIHFNPVKHGLVARAADWQFSTIHRFIARGDVNENWACAKPFTTEKPRSFGE